MKLRQLVRIISVIYNRRATFSEIVGEVYGEQVQKTWNHLTFASFPDTLVAATPAYYSTLQFSERPNPSAKIAFIICYPFHYHAYKNIYCHLRDAEFLIDGQFMKSALCEWWVLLNRLIQILQRDGAYYRIIWDYDEDMEKKCMRYQILLAHNYVRLLSFPCNAKKKKIRIMYGHSKDLYNLGAWLRHFNLALAFGTYSAKKISQFTDVVVTGNYIFDDWFSGKITTGTNSDLNELHQRLDPRRKTVLYLPTHGDLSSLEFMVPVLAPLLRDYNVIIKLHYMTRSQEPDRAKRFQRAVERHNPKNVIWIDEFIDPTIPFAFADVVVSDNSGAIFDAVLLNKPLAILDTIGRNFFARHMKTFMQLAEGTWRIPLTYKNSIEQRIKRDGTLRPGVIVRRATDLPRVIQYALKSDYRYARNRQRLRKLLFSYVDGKSGQRAAKAIAALQRRKIQEPAFAALSLNVEATLENALRDRIRYVSSVAIDSYLNRLPLFKSFGGENEILFSVIIAVHNKAIQLPTLLRVIIDQTNIDKGRVELIVVDDGSADDTPTAMKIFVNTHPDIKLCYIRLAESRGAGYTQNVGILRANGTFVCFIDTDYDYEIPPTWLSQLHSAFKTHREIAGIKNLYCHRSAISKNNLERFRYYLYAASITSDIKFATISPFYPDGSGAPICYRASILKKVGGFNHYFQFASSSAIELAIRMGNQRMPLLYQSLVATRRNSLTIRRFVREELVSGWTLRLLAACHPIERHKISELTPLAVLIDFFDSLGKLKRFSVEIHPIRFSDKLRFTIFLLLQIFCRGFGKYWIAFEIATQKK